MPIFDPPTPPNSNSVVPQSAIDRGPAPVDVGTPAVPVVPRSAIDRKPDPVDPGVAIGTPSGPAGPVSVAAPVKETPVVPTPAFVPSTTTPTTVVKYLSVSDEGVGISTNVTAMNFIGNGVVVTNNPNGASAVDITITSGGVAYGNSNVVTLLAGFGSNVLSTTGNVTGGNVMTSAQVIATGVVQSGTGLSTGGYLSVNGTADLHDTTVTGNLSATGNITGSYVLGNGSQLTGLAATYSNSNVQAYLPTYSGNIGALTVTGNLTVTGTTSTVNTEVVNVSESVVGNIDAGNLRTAGQVSAAGNITGNFFIGNGSTLSSLTGGNVSGTVANATYALTSNAATYATQATTADTANAVAGANVSGTVANATYALTSNAATYSTQATYAGTANAVAGANVSGTVANATYATSAGSATTANTVTDAAQGNITSVGILTSLSVSGNITAANLGNIASLNLNSNASTVLYGNGTFASLPASSSYGNADVTTLLGNLGSNVISSTGNISTTANISGGYILGNGSQLTSLPAPTVSQDISSTGDMSIMTYDGVIKSVNYATVEPSSGNIKGGNITTTGLVSATGNITAGNISTTGNIIAGNVDTVNLVVNNISSDDSTLVSVQDGLQVYGNIIADNLGNIASINLDGNVSNVLSGTGTWITAAGGAANTGNVTFSDQVVMGTGGNDGTGGLYLAPGNASIANSAVQYLRVRGGDVATHIHLDTGNNQYYDQYFGDDGKYVKLANTGNIVINSNDDAGNTAQWTFDTTGNLTLPSGGDILVDNGKIISADGEDFKIIVQDSNDDGYRLDLVVTDGTDHATRVEVGRDGVEIITNLLDVANQHNWRFKSDGNLNLPGNLVIAGNTSVFGTDAALIQTTDNRPLLALSSGANGGVSSLWVEDYANASTSNIAAVYTNPVPGSGNVRIAVGQNGNAGPNLWDFDATGNLTLPSNAFAVNYANGTAVSLGSGTVTNVQGDGIVSGLSLTGNVTTTGNLTLGGTLDLSSLSGNISTTGNIAGGNVLTGGGITVTGNVTGGNLLTNSKVVMTPVAYSALAAVSGARAFVNDGNLVASGNFGAQVIGGGSNVVPVWSDGANWYIG